MFAKLVGLGHRIVEKVRALRSIDSSVTAQWRYIKLERKLTDHRLYEAASTDS